jgi:predicted outer membrane repeat protein
MKRLILFVVVAGFICRLSSTAFGEIIHVPAAEYPTIQSGINAASLGDTVLVADGTYLENILFGGSKAITLISQNGAGSTVIDGGHNGTVVAFAAGDNSTLNGFTITNGSTQANGGGVLCGSSSSPTIANCIITNNEALIGGGGIHCAPSSAPFITNSIIQDNSVTDVNNNISNGGGIHASTFSTPTISNCIIKNNTSNWNGGGLALNAAFEPKIVNCTFSNNTAAVNGGAISFQDSAPIITNCTFSNNSASGNGGAIACSNPLPGTAVANSILWKDSPVEISSGSATFSVTYSDIHGGYTGTGNINADPKFVDETNGDFHLRNDSPCIDAGDNSAPALPATDIDGDERKINDPAVADTGNGTPPIVDIGADEYVREVKTIPSIPLLLLE